MGFIPLSMTNSKRERCDPSRSYPTSCGCVEHISGLGISLFVTREIVALHGGGIAVSSAEGLGTTVSIRLPLLTADAEHPTTVGEDGPLCS